MKRICRIIPTLLLVFFGLGISISCHHSTSDDKLFSLLEEFKNPPAQYRSIPFWVWNDRMSYAKIDRMLSDFKEQGCGGVFVTPRYGLITEYLSSEWFDLLVYSTKKAKELGLYLWLYDDNSYPSGFAGGLLPAQMPEAASQGIALEPYHAFQLPQNVDEMYIVLRRAGEGYEDISAHLNEFKGVQGNYYMYRKVKHETSDWFAGFSYVDLLKKGVTERFLDIAMKGNREHLGAEFGKTIPGVYTDEPHINTPSKSIRWTEDLFPLFRKTYGYGLEHNLIALHGEIKGYQQVRHDYYKLLLTMFVDRWAKPCHDFYEKQNLQLTGHYWEHEWPRLGPCPDNMALVSWLQQPGLDLLFNQFNEQDPRAQFGNIRIVKEISSVASQMGRKRVLAEMYGGAGWDLTFKDQKRLGDWAFVHGVNSMTQHLSHTSLIGTRKYDYPPMFSSAAPWWSNYKYLNDYFARLSLLLSKGEQINDILLIEPTTTVWMYSSHLGDSPRSQEIADKFHTLIMNMSTNQIEYDLGSEEVMRLNAKVLKDKFIVGKRSYHTVVIPPMTENIEGSTFQLLQQFAKNGGLIIAHDLPHYLDGRPNSEVTSFFAKLPVRMVKEGDIKALEKILPISDITYERSRTGNLFHMRRQFKDGQLIFLVNSDLDAAEDVTIHLKSNYVVELDALTGEMYNIEYSPEKGKIHLQILPAESKLLFLSKHAHKAKSRELTAHIPIPSSSPLIRSRVGDNFLTLDYVDLAIDGIRTNGIHVLRASEHLFRRAGFPNGNPWFMKIQYKNHIVRRDTFKDKGFSVYYRFKADASTPLTELKIAVERPHLYSLFVNGKQVSVPTSPAHLFDDELLVIPIGNEAVVGENVLELRASKFSVYAEIEPVYVIGDFDVKWDQFRFYLSKANTTTVLGTWKELGCPFYPYAMDYSKIYTLSKIQNKQFELSAPHFKGALAEVWVNGKRAGIIFSNPYTLNISVSLREGENTIMLRVIGGMENLIGPFYFHTKGLTEPRAWMYIEGQLKAPEYIFTPYGLSSDFELISN